MSMDQSFIPTEDVDELDGQLGENALIEEFEEIPGDSARKRELLGRTKIVRQTWSIREIYNKIKTGNLILDPKYQRNDIWNSSKRVPFIESLFMGILIPPIYVVELAAESVMDENKYEVVDGKQRLSTIKDFLDNKLILKSNYLEYYADNYGNKDFHTLRNIAAYTEEVNELLSSTLDINVITENSPEFTKYDIFARLNKGSQTLQADEIRKAIYRSDTIEHIENFIEGEYMESIADEHGHTKSTPKEEYKLLFTENEILHYKDYGRFFASIAYFMNFNPDNKTVENYNSRPRDMINNILIDIQEKRRSIDNNSVEDIIKETLKLTKIFNEKEIPKNQIKHLIDACVFCAVKSKDAFYQKLDDIIVDTDIQNTFLKSVTTTNNVNMRFKRVYEIVND